MTSFFHQLRKSSLHCRCSLDSQDPHAVEVLHLHIHRLLPQIAAYLGDKPLEFQPPIWRRHHDQLPAFVAVMRAVRRIDPVALRLTFDRRAAKTLPEFGDDLGALSWADAASIVAPGWNQRGNFHDPAFPSSVAPV